MTEYAPGAWIGDRYVLEAPAGRGASAVVWRARDDRTGKSVAIKIFDDEVMGDNARVWRSRELKALSVLDHPSIVRMLDTSGSHAEDFWICTEWLDGADFQSLVQVRGAVPEAALIAIAQGALAALSAAHALTIVHRDIKPANLFLCRSGRVVLLDFGLARALDESAGQTLITPAGTSVVGTPNFLSPEQVGGEKTHASSDLYSLGVTLRYLLTGVLPIQAKGVMELLGAIAKGQISPIGRDVASADTIRALDQLTALHIEDRPASAERATEMFRALSDSHGGTQAALQRYVEASFGGGSENTTSTTQRTAVATLSVTAPSSAAEKDQRIVYAVAALVIALALVAGLWLVKRPKPPAPPPMVARAGDDTALAVPAPASIPVVPPPPPPLPAETPVRKPTPLVEPKGNGVLQLTLRQWAHVEIDGVDRGRKQVSARFELPAGSHALVLRNPTYGERSIRVNVRSGQTQTVAIDFTASVP
jgi:serine/threonine protein kinase